jgi:hypothetical protein
MTVTYVYGIEEWNLMVAQAKEVLAKADEGVIAIEQYLSYFPYEIEGETK